MNVRSHSNVDTPTHAVSKERFQSGQYSQISHLSSADSVNHNRDFKCSIIDPHETKVGDKTTERLIHFTTFLSIISSFCVYILTKCLTVFINKVGLALV